MESGAAGTHLQIDAAASIYSGLEHCFARFDCREVRPAALGSAVRIVATYVDEHGDAAA